MAAKPLKLKSSSTVPKEKKAGEAGMPQRCWKVLIVDDAPEIHSITRMILGKMVFDQRPLTLISAHSAAEARQILAETPDIALVLLDVVMENDHAGLDLVRWIREDQNNAAIRIILRTGQPGQAPEEKVIIDYDINDYKAKTELTAQKLFTAVVGGLRAWRDIISLQKTRKGLEKILNSTDTLFDIHSLRSFSSGVLEQLGQFLGCQPDGVLLIQKDRKLSSGSSGDSSGDSGTDPFLEDVAILASTGAFDQCRNCKHDYQCLRATESDECDLCEAERICPLSTAIQVAREALKSGKVYIGNNFVVLYLNPKGTPASAILLHGVEHVEDEDRLLLGVFASKISIALANALHYGQMISAREAATIDVLTGLPNRRHLIDLGAERITAARHSASPLTVAMVDVDHFKAINDALGHDGGDIVLRHLGKILRDELPEKAVAARFGGEEFCLLLPDYDDPAAAAFLDGLRETIAQATVELREQSIALTVSIGATTRLEDLDAMIKRADKRLYAAKKNGRNRVVLDGTDGGSGS